MALPGRRSAATRPRRGGPRDEARWWDSADQARAERVAPRRIGLPRKWKPTTMVNNVEVLDPYEGIGAASKVVEARARRRRTALVEGDAWRGPRRQIVVLRVEAFADADVDLADHRAAWARDGAECLVETWRQRWTEREVEPGWIEATHREEAGADPRIDWFRIEDHTGLADPTDVSIYQHLTLWAGRGVAVVTLRHLLDSPVDDAALWFGDVVLARLANAFDVETATPRHP
jgi:hypothetical protein